MAYFDISGEILIEELVENEERAEIRLHQRNLRDISNPFELPNTLFKNLFRFEKEVMRIIIDQIIPHMREEQRITAIPAHLKILVTMHFYGTGGYQLPTGQGHNFALSQASTSRCISEVTDVIYNYLLPTWIEFPNTVNKRNKVINGFMEKYNFPQCLGAIDCTHIAIISPPEDYPSLPYFSRKGYYSINCQIIADSDYKIISINARFPGSTHDSAIWQASNIQTVMANLYVQGNNFFLIGDSGYPLQPFLLTPFENPEEGTPESRYNYYFIRARNIIEKVNGLLKSRFRCLSKHRVLNYEPIKAGKIIYSCAVLHNMACFYKDNLFEEEMRDLDDNNEEVINIIHGNNNWHARGQQIRTMVVQQYFTNI